MMKIATSLNLCPPFLTEEALMPRLRSAGYDGVDFNFCDLTRRIDWSDERAADAFVDSWGTAAKGAGLDWVQSHGPMFNVFGDSEWDVKGRQLAPLSLRACGQLGVPWMVLHPETLPGGVSDSASYAEQLRRNVEYFQTLLPLCEKYNVGIALENLPEPMAARGGVRCFCGTAPELIELIDTLNHPLIGACWDTGHAKINRLEQRSAIGCLGSRLKVLHIQENDGKGDDHMMPFVNGPAGIDWKTVIEGLRIADYQGAFTYEAHNSFRAVPEVLFDDVLHLSAKVARHLASQITPTQG
jgi:sugar phosphate isomerase/epimerase